jgi:hypothetical protein
MEHRFTYPTVREISSGVTEPRAHWSRLPARGKSQRELVVDSLLRRPDRRAASTRR